MHSRTHFHRRLLAGLFVLAAALPLAQAGAAQPEAPTVPTKIQVAEGHRVFLVGHAVGVQIYTCKIVAGAPAWSLTAPRAVLKDDNGKAIIDHYGGPSWKHRDGSTITGSRVDGVTMDSSAIPWLLLSATPVSSGPDADRLAGTKFIQRVATTGGLAPSASTCTTDTLGAVEEIPYTADYYFWKMA